VLLQGFIGKNAKIRIFRSVWLHSVSPGEKADYVKFLHNASTASELSPDEPDYHLAEFLMFIQHVQYAITGGLTYVSDFQGNIECSSSSC